MSELEIRCMAALDGKEYAPHNPHFMGSMVDTESGEEIAEGWCPGYG